MARFTGGPKIEFISGRLATTFGFAGSEPMSTIVTESLPGGRICSLPSSPQVTLLSIPTIMYSGLPEDIRLSAAQAARVAAAMTRTRDARRLLMISSARLLQPHHLHRAAEQRARRIAQLLQDREVVVVGA